MPDATTSPETETGVEGIVLDIEGTICPISFVKDVLYPYSLNTLPKVLSEQWGSPVLIPYLNAFPPEHRQTPEALQAHFTHLLKTDTKTPYFKSLQGYLWTHGYESEELLCTLFPDVFPALKLWKSKGIRIVIYSSGSVAAQKLLFQYTTDGDLRGLVTEGGWWDIVNAGLKREKVSYERILEGMGARDREKWWFFSDQVAEVDAAREAGMRGLVVVREGNGVIGEEERERHRLIGSFEGVEFGGGS